MTLPRGLEDNLRYYAAWREIFPGEAFIYDYHLGRVHYGDPGYMKIARTLYEDLGRLNLVEVSNFYNAVAAEIHVSKRF